MIEGEFETLLSQPRPSDGLLNLALQMLRDLWNAKLASVQSQGLDLKKELAAIERKVEQMFDRIVDATSDSVIAAYERRIKELEMQRAVMRDRIANSGKPLRSFAETYRTAVTFLANPWKLWKSEKVEDRRAVLKLAFADRLPYVRGEGYRTAKISMPFRLLGDSNRVENGMVPRGGIEPPTLRFSVACSTN